MKPRLALLVTILSASAVGCGDAPHYYLPIDAGGDAADGDAAPIDASASDAGVDANRIDGGLPASPFGIGFGGIDNDLVNAYATHGDDAIVGGLLTGTVNLGGGNRTGPAFVARYNPEGLHRWSLGFGANNVRAIGVDGTGNVLVAGDFSGSFTWPGTSTTRTSVGGTDVFIAKLDAATGAHVWSASYGGIGNDNARDLAVASNGDVVVTGEFVGTADYGGADLTSGGGIDVFVARYAASNGAHVWSRSFSGGGNDTAGGVAIDGDGAILVGGSFFTTITLATAALNTAGSADMWMAKLNGSNGVTVWGQRYGGTGVDRINGITAGSAAAEVYVTGSFSNSFAFGGSTVTSAGNWDIFAGRIDGTNGAAVWASGFGATDLDQGFDVTMDADGSVLVTGEFRGTAAFGADSLASAGNADVFYVDLNATTGAAIDARRFGGVGSDNGERIRVNASGLVDIAGSYSGIVDFGTAALISNGNKDLFVVRFAP